MKNFYWRNLAGIFLSALIIGAFWFFSSYHQINQTTELLKGKAVAEQRQELKQRVMHVANMIRHEQSLMPDLIHQEVRTRTYEAYAIMEAIYHKHKDRLTREQIAGQIRNTLRVMRYDGNRGYYFATGLDGVEQLYPPAPDLEGKNLLEKRDLNNKPVIQDMIRIIQEQGEGAYEYTWTNPDEPHKQFKKVAYVKYFKPLNWFVGTGIYVDDIIKKLQDDLIKRIEQIKFENSSYIFVGNFNGISQTYPAKGKNMYEVQDKNGLKIVQEMIKISQQGNGYLEYVMPPLEGQSNNHKISFVIGIPEWQWYVGSGEFVADLDAQISTMLKQRRANLNRNMAAITAFLIVFLSISAYIAHRSHLKINRIFLNFSEFFKSAATQTVRIDPEKQIFSEFEELACSANEMVEKRDLAEKELVAEEFKFRTLFEHVPNYILILEHKNDQMLIADLSETACLLHGYERSDLVGQPISVLDPNERAVEADDPRINRLMEGETVRFEVVHRRKDGSTFPVESLIKMVEMDKNQFFFAIERDLTEQKQLQRQQQELEEQVRQKYKMEAVGLMAGGIAHNFNNSLAVVLGNLEMAQRKLSQPEKVKEYLENAGKAVLTARDLIQQIMLYSRKGEHKMKAVKLHLIVEETIKMLRSTTPTTLELEYTSSEQSRNLSIYADPVQIQEVLLNLFTNAKHATDEEGQIIFTLDQVVLNQKEIPAHFNGRAGQYARLRVKDNGCGIAQDTLDKIFDPFFTTKEVDEGTGMGLSTVQGVINQHGGLIKVCSEIGSGTTFDLYFPLNESLSTENHRDDKLVESKSGSERILFVDDDPMLTDIVGQMLKELGYQFTSVSNAQEALELVSNHPQDYDLVITDQTMPGMTGKDLAQKIKENCPTLPVILCTGYSSKISEENIDQYGISAYCNKPLRLSEFSQSIRTVLDQKTTPS